MVKAGVVTVSVETSPSSWPGAVFPSGVPCRKAVSSGASLAGFPSARRSLAR